MRATKTSHQELYLTLLSCQILDLLTVKGVSLSDSGRPSDVWTFTVDVVTPTTSHSENAFDRLMAGSRRLFQMERQNRMPQLPAMKSSSSPGFTQKDALQNHIIKDLLEKNGLQFKDKHVLMLRVLTDTLWNIELPSVLMFLVSCRGFNDNKKKEACRTTGKEDHRKSYYSSQKFPNVCAHWGHTECTVVDELKASFRTVLQVFNCGERTYS